jgi:hypothetical protein
MSVPIPGRRVLLGVAAAATLARIAPARADALGKPADKPILTISGKIAQTNDGKVARFDRPLLEALGTASITTTTPWHDHPVQFEGVPMQRIMQAVGAQGEKIKVVALDDYSAQLPIADFGKYGTLLALKMAGKYMSVAEKGPSFIVYPFDQFAELRNATYYGRAVFQIATIEVI